MARHVLVAMMDVPTTAAQRRLAATSHGTSILCGRPPGSASWAAPRRPSHAPRPPTCTLLFCACATSHVHRQPTLTLVCARECQR
eukprot:scaffold187724_cov35-Tisochrysis_lutea.AAC.1